LYSKRFSVGLGVNTLLLGADEAYQDGSILFFGLTPDGGRSTSLIANKREGANNLGLFVQNEISFSEKVSILLGGRYDNITYYYDDYITPLLNDSKSFERFTPKIGVTVRVSPTQSVYANLGGGVEVPAGNEVDPAPTFGDDTVRAINPLLEPITSTTAEIGMKQVFPSDIWSFASYDIALYWIDVRNDIIPYSGGAFYFTAGKTRRYGIEIGGQMNFNNGLSFSAALTFSKNTYEEYMIDSVHYGNPGTFANLKDKEMSGVPSNFYNVDARYSPSAANYLFLKAGAHGVGSYFADDANAFTVPQYAVVDGGLGVDHLMFGEGKVGVSAFIGLNNTFDRTYAASAWINPDLVGGVPVYLDAGLPRNFVGSLALNWNF
jgi:iron complex outermembrane receptor protein